MSDAAKQEVAQAPDAVQDQGPSAYRMPMVSLNDHVLWYDDGDLGSEGHPAVVVRVHAESVDVKILGVGATQTYRSGVRHVTDPKLKQNHFVRESGGWDYSASALRLADACYMVSKLSEEVTKLVTRVNQLEGRLEVVGLGADGIAPPKKKAS